MMKTIQTLFALLPWLLALDGFCDGFTYPLDSNTVEIGFADPTLSDTLKERIFSDIMRVRAPWTDVSIVFSDFEDTHGVINDESVYWTPWGYEEYGYLREFSVKSPNHLLCTVPDSLSRRYEEAFAFAATNSAAWDAALAFAAFLNAGDFSSVSTNREDGIFYPSGLTAVEYASELPGVTNILALQSYSLPSVLSLRYRDAGFGGVHEQSLWVSIPLGFPKNGPAKTFMHIDAVWDGTRWRVVFQAP